MGLSIKNAETERLARELARQTGESITAAITHALEERLAKRHAPSATDRRRQIAELICQRVQGLPELDARAPDEIIGYDENGLPS